MAIVWHTAPINSIEDVRHRETLMGGTGPTSGTVFGPYLLNNLAGMKFKVISGFNGTNEIALAMQRGEVEGSATPLESLTSYRADWVRERKIKILVQYTAVRDPEVADIPTMVELGRTEEDRQILGYYASSADVGRSIVAPPGIPADTVTALRRAFDTMLADPVFLEDVKKMGIQLKPLPGEHLQKIIMQVANFPQGIGLVPKQHSSGGRDRLGGISKQGDRYLRSLFVAGALAVIRYAKIHGTKYRPWVAALLARRPTKVAAIALANKLARMAWAMMATGERYNYPASLRV
jgi:hypothetical protein